MGDAPPPVHPRTMDQLLLAQLVSYAGLLAATVEYCEIVRRRRAVRDRVAARSEMLESGLQGLVRVFLLDHER